MCLAGHRLSRKAFGHLRQTIFHGCSQYAWMLRSVFSAKTLRAGAGPTSTTWSLRTTQDSATIFLLGTYCNRLHSNRTENSGLAAEEPGARAFAPTLNRPFEVIEVAGMRIFARHHRSCGALASERSGT